METDESLNEVIRARLRDARSVRRLTELIQSQQMVAGIGEIGVVGEC